MKIITLQNGKSLNEQQFINYFEKKVLYTIRKFSLFQNSQKPSIKDLFKIKKFKSLIISKECLDDISVKIIESLMKKQGTNKLESLLPKSKNIIRPFYLISKKEIELYAKLKRIKIKKESNSKIQSWLNSLEQKHPEIKNSIVSSLLRIAEKHLNSILKYT